MTSAVFDSDKGRVFLKNMQELSDGDWTGGYRQFGDNIKPQLPRDEYHCNDRYFSALFSASRQLRDNIYTDGSFTTLHPEVDQAISAQGPYLKLAFLKVFQICCSYQRALDATRPSGSQGRQITREKHGLSDKQVEEMHNALLQIWKAYPEMDTRVNEALDFVHSNPAIHKIFQLPSGGRWSFGKSIDDRADYRLADRIETYDGAKLPRMDSFDSKYAITPEQLAAIAEQAIKNFEKMKEFSKVVAEQSLAGFIRVTHKDGNKIDTQVAKQILENISSGKTMAEQEARKIRTGKYGTLSGGYKKWFFPDKDRIAAKTVTGRAAEYLAICMNIQSGAYFQREIDRLQDVCVQKKLPGFDSAPVFTAPKVKAVKLNK